MSIIQQLTLVRFLEPRRVKYVPRVGKGPYDNYIAVNLDFNLSIPLLEQLNQTEYAPLTSRHEAHITVINPAEYTRVLKTYFDIDELHQLALRWRIQEADMNPICVGKASQLETNKTSKFYGKRSSVFYIVLQSYSLTGFRYRILQELVNRGGDASNFCPTCYHPHITVGFQEHDWFPENDVFKTPDTCFAAVQMY